MVAATSVFHFTSGTRAARLPSAQPNAISKRSESSKGSSTCVSGSPKRQLYSRSMGPSLVSINPPYSTPTYLLSSFASASTVRCNTSSTSRRSRGVRHGAGAYAPIPPVFGPLSPSSARLWSCAGTIIDIVLPSAKAMQLHSSPSSNCSMTTSSPADPKAPSNITDLTASSASSRDSGIRTPFPAARPLALTTHSRPAAYSALTYSRAASYSPFWKFRNAAVGRLYFVKRSFENALEASSSAARLLGPKHCMPFAAHASASPAHKGASGPTNTNATFFSVARATKPCTSVSPTATFVMSGSSDVPPFPGAQKTCPTFGDSRSFTAIACSRPPPPTTSTFAAPSLVAITLLRDMSGTKQGWTADPFLGAKTA
mmetsp:Transcript_8397/g.21471  ORF Transcript_8397/g.21471 Transcript_8397/m.21471 type:complete len:371 (+) Transcript_8397:1101-2213(+)